MKNTYRTNCVVCDTRCDPEASRIVLTPKKDLGYAIINITVNGRIPVYDRI